MSIKQFCKDLERTGGKVRALTKNFTDHLGITVFGYARIYNNGRASWLSSKPEQDLFLLESPQIFATEPLLDTQEGLQEGAYIFATPRRFEGDELFHEERRKRFGIDHGMALVKHQKDYLEAGFFSGLVSKQPLFNTFVNDKALYYAFMDHFSKQLNRELLQVLEGGFSITEVKKTTAKQQQTPGPDRSQLLAACGLQHLLELSTREKECLLLFRAGYTYEGIGKKLFLSARTVEHYLESIKNKLNKESRPELYIAADFLQN